MLVYLYEKGESRHGKLEELIRSRGSLATNLNDLLKEGLVNRKVIPSKPIQSNYFLTEKGRDVAKLLVELKTKLT